jgi:nicotinamide mononucleotide transporter
VFDRFTDAHVPYWDAGCAGISVAAQILMMKRRIESWHLWVVVDVVYTALYATKGAWLTVILYAIFAVIAIGGLREWRRSTTVRDA